MDLNNEEDFEESGSDSFEQTKSERPVNLVWVFIKEVFFILVIAYILAFLLKTIIIQPFMIPSSSMEPTFYPGDRVLVARFSYWLGEPKRSDIIVFEAPFDSHKDYIKRVIATEGEAIEVKSGIVYINGKKIDEPYLINMPDLSNFGPITIPEDKLFVMGDNRPSSQDSRIFGPIDKDTIIGKAILTYWPPHRIALMGRE